MALQLNGQPVKTSIQFLGQQGAKTGLAAAAIADMLGVPLTDIAEGLPLLRPFSGRMQVLDGIKNSSLIDDTYNASPIAVTAALDVLCSVQAPQRIAILGSMNELGDASRQAHETVGAYCDPAKIAVVVTIGADAKRWLAPVARQNGCTVHCFSSPNDAGAYVSGKLINDAVVLAKGSQNGVFAEEALKPLLRHPGDQELLVRQSAYWLARKAQQFS